MTFSKRRLQPRDRQSGCGYLPDGAHPPDLPPHHARARRLPCLPSLHTPEPWPLLREDAPHTELKSPCEPGHRERGWRTAGLDQIDRLAQSRLPSSDLQKSWQDFFGRAVTSVHPLDIGKSIVG